MFCAFFHKKRFLYIIKDRLFIMSLNKRKFLGEDKNTNETGINFYGSSEIFPKNSK